MYKSEEPRIETRPKCDLSEFSVRTVESVSTRAMHSSLAKKFNPTHSPLGDARTSRLGPAAQTCPSSAPAGGATSPPVDGTPGPVSPLSPLGCDTDTAAYSPLRHGQPVALGPTRSRVARHESTCDSDDSARAGGDSEEAAARSTTSQAKTCLANRSTSYHSPLCH